MLFLQVYDATFGYTPQKGKLLQIKRIGNKRPKYLFRKAYHKSLSLAIQVPAMHLARYCKIDLAGVDIKLLKIYRLGATATGDQQYVIK